MAGTATLPRSPAQARRRVVSNKGYIAATWERLLEDRVSMVAVWLLGLVALLSLLAPFLVTSLLGVDPLHQDLFNQYARPGPGHWLGTDDLGRDVLARVLYAGQVSLTIGFAIAIVSILIGLPVGVASGYYGGRFDDVSNAVIQTLLNVPDLFLLILLSVTLRPEPFQLAMLIGALGWMGTARQVRAQALSVRQREYVQAALVMGADNRRIMLRHVFPNLFSVVSVISGFSMAGGILAESGLSYLGLGVRPPTASWGNMLNNSIDNVSRAPWLVIGPGFMIFVTVLSIFLIADGLRDALDPRLKG